ncbi:hypothetical protein JCM8097_004129 [Rhodosporidiobolus ruineniae]
MSSSYTDKKCWVCGKDAVNRCSACSKAGLEIFFCSSEHQRMVWPIHRKVCGPGKANPFFLPPLTADEAVEAKRHADVEVRMPYSRGPYSLRIATTDVDSGPEALDDTLESLQTKSIRVPEQQRIEQQVSLALVRCVETERQALMRKPGGPPPAAVDFALGEVSGLIAQVLRPHMEATSDPHRDIPYLTPFLHRAAVLFFLNADFLNWEREAAFENSKLQFEAMRAFAERYIQPTHPEVAALLPGFFGVALDERVARWMYGVEAVEEAKRSQGEF